TGGYLIGIGLVETVSGGTLAISGTDAKVLDQPLLINLRTPTATGSGTVYVKHSGRFENVGVLDFTGDASISYNGGNQGSFRNGFNSTLKKTGGTGTSTIQNVAFSDHGLIDVRAGTLAINLPGGGVSKTAGLPGP